jgi:hypothetical protein
MNEQMNLSMLLDSRILTYYPPTIMQLLKESYPFLSSPFWLPTIGIVSSDIDFKYEDPNFIKGM